MSRFRWQLRLRLRLRSNADSVYILRGTVRWLLTIDSITDVIAAAASRGRIRLIVTEIIRQYARPIRHSDTQVEEYL